MKNKRVFSIILFILTFTCTVAFSSFNALAETTAQVSSSQFLTHQGEEFTTTIYIPDNANIVDFDITLKYDTELVKLINAAENEDIKGSLVFNTDNPGEIAVNYTRTSKNVTSYLPILDLTFTVDDNIGIGSYDCFTIDKNYPFVAHRLNPSGKLETVDDFSCDFSKLVIYEMGDVDLSEVVDIGDATCIRRHLAEFEGSVFDDFKLSLADTYSDGIVDIGDAVCLQRHLARLDVLYGNRVNVTFVDIDGNKYATKSVLYNGTLKTIPAVPTADGYTTGNWSQSSDKFVEPIYSNLTKDITLYAYYDGQKSSEAMEYYKRLLTDQYYSGDLPTNLSSDLNLWSTMNYQSGYYANLIWNSDCNYVLNSTTGEFTKPTYPKDMALTAKIISYDSDNRIESEDTITFNYAVPGEFTTPTKASVEDFLKFYFTDDTDGKYRVNYDVKLISKLNNTVLPVEGALYDNFEIRLDWYQNVDGELMPINQIKRTTSSQTNDYVAVATFNGKPLEGDGKIYIDNVEVTAIQQIEIKNHIINEIAANMGTLATDGVNLWNDDSVYGTKISWETGNNKIAYVSNNTIKLKDDAITGSTLPLNARVSYAIDGGTEEFILSYNLTVSCNNTIIKAPENMDPDLYKAIKAELEDKLGYRGDLTSAALANVKFVNLDLSGYPDIASLRGLSYCTNLRTLNISGLHITDGTMNQIATLSYLEAFIARGCDLDNLSDGGTPTLRNAVNLKLIDLTDNNFTSLDSVFAEGVKYGKLREVYLSSNKLTDINALQRAPIMTYLSLSDNGLTTAGTASVANYPYLVYLSLADNKIDSVEHLKGLKYLQELRLQNNCLTDVRNLRGLVNLEILYLGHNQIKDIGFLNSLTALEVLYANDNLINDISALTNLSKLEIINVSNNNISSLTVLRNYKSTLTEIYAENNNVTDFSFINGAEKLHILMLAGNKAVLAQDNMSIWLKGLAKLEILTLSEIKLNDLSFLESMTKLARLDIAGCGISAFSGDVSNIALIADKYSTLRILDISNNDMRGYEDELLKLKNATILTVFYADNVCDALDAYTLTYSMSELRYISFENCGIDSLNWLYKYNNLVYVDLAGNKISDVNIEKQISNASVKTLKELYLDTTIPCSFTNAYRTTDFNVNKLSLSGVSIGKVENLPYLDQIEYLNLSNTGLTNLIGDDAEYSSLYSLERYQTVKTLDLSGTKANIDVVKTLPELKELIVVDNPENRIFFENNLHILQQMYNKGVTCYLYDKETEYVPTATKEGKDILNLIKDFSCDITVAADNMISDNNPFITSEINDFDIDWTISNSKNYEIVDNHLTVKDYYGLEDEKLTLTASITVYPDQPPVSREFTINTHILRANSNYYAAETAGYSKQLTRDAQFIYRLSLKSAETEGFSVPVKPVEDRIDYSYSATASNGTNIPYPNILTVKDNSQFVINSTAPLGSTVLIKIDIRHAKNDGSLVDDIQQIVIPITVASRTFTAGFVMNGGTIVDENGIVCETREYVEDSLIFEDLTYSKPGYEFKGWYTDADFNSLFSLDGVNAKMPSSSITLYAKWNALEYSVLFDANGGEVSINKKTVLSNVELGELPVPIRQYYTFDGWFTQSGEKVTETSKFARTEDLTLYAHWTLNSFVITFNANGGTVGTSNIRAYCSKPIGDLPTPVRDYYTFDGWYTELTNGTKVTNNTIYETAKDLILYAHWKLNPESSDWILASKLPSGAQVTQTKWSYTLRSYTTSGSSSMSGWTKYDTKRTSWGSWSGWSRTNPSNGVRNVESRSVYDHTEYHYYRWTDGKGGVYTYKYNNSYHLEEKWFDHKLPVYDGGSQGSCIRVDGSGYKNRWVEANYAGNRSTDKTFTRSVNRTEWRYQEPVYTYYFYKDETKESTTDPTGQSNVSNVVKYVKYREK